MARADCVYVCVCARMFPAILDQILGTTAV